MKILILAAHPDDEVLGMGGTIKKYTKKGHEVKVVFMATGISSRRSVNYKNSPVYSVNKKTKKIINKQINELHTDARNAAKIMGVKDIDFINFPDNEMDLVSNLQVTKTIESIIADFQPNVIFTHSPHDVNVDHRMLYDSTITATRPTTTCRVDEVISFEVPSSTEWYFPSQFSPNIFVDISSELDAKVKALAAYKNEVREFPHPRSIEAMSIIAKRWGTVCGFRAAEAFSLVRRLRRDI